MDESRSHATPPDDPGHPGHPVPRENVDRKAGSAPRHRGRKVVLIVLAGIVALLVIGWIAIPYIVSAESVRRRVAGQLSEQVGALVQVEDHDFSWFDGLSVSGVSIANPEGFPQDQPALRLGELHGDLSLMSMLGGRFDLAGKVKGMEFRLYQRADGTTNLGTMLGTDRREAKPREGDRQPPEFDLERLQVDLRVEDCFVEIVHEEHGVLETLSGIQGELKKTYEATDARLRLEADLGRPGTQAGRGGAGEGEPAEGGEVRGRLDLLLVVDSDLSKPSELKFEAVGLELSRYLPLLHAFLEPAQRPTQLAGLIAGELNGSFAYGKTVALGGELTVKRPRLAGGMLGTIVLRGEEWSLRPRIQANLSPEFAVESVSSEGFAADLGFLRITGIDPAAAKAAAAGRQAIGFDVLVDLDELAKMDIPGLSGLRDGAGKVEGRTSLATDWPAGTEPAAALAAWPTLLRADLAVEVDGYRDFGLEVDGWRSRLVAADATIGLDAKEATVNGGPFSLALRAPVDGDPEQPASLELDWKDGVVRGDAVRWLRYVVPLLAGLPVDNAVGIDFSSKVTTLFSGTGPALPAGEETVLQWLDHWQGEGQLALAGGHVVPAEVWQRVLAFMGEKGRLEFDGIDTKFALRQGAIQAEALRISKRATAWSLNGKVGLDGSIDYALDLRDVIGAHRDGAKILRYVGEQSLAARLTGSVDAPRLEAPDAGELVERALRGAAAGALEDILEGKPVQEKLRKGLEGLLDRKKEKDPSGEREQR